MQTHLQQGQGTGTRSKFISSSSHNGFVEFELTSRQFQKIKLALPKPFYLIDPHNEGLEKVKKKLMDTFRQNQNSNNEQHIWASDIKQKITNPFAKQKQSSENKKKNKQDHTSKIKESDKNNNGKKRNLMKNKAMIKKETEIKSINQQPNANNSKFEGFQAQMLKRKDKKIQHQNMEQQKIVKQNEELPPKSEPSFKQNDQFFENLNHQNFENHILKTPLEILDGGEHFFQYRPIRSLSSGQPRFIFRQQLEHQQIHNQSSTLRYEFGLPFYSVKGDNQQKLNQKQKNFCNNILHKLKAHRSSQGFRVPVDPDVQGVPDYFNVIYQPMDLQTMTKKVCKDKYRYISEFHADISKILLNSYKYNPRQTVYFEAAIDFEDYYHYLLRDAEQRSEQYATQNLAKHPKLKKGDDFGELEFTQQTPIKKTRRDSKTRIKKSKSIIDFDEYHPQYQMFGQQLKNYSIGYDDEYVVPNKKGKDLKQQFFEIQNVKDGEEIRIFGKSNQEIGNQEQKQFYLKNQNKDHQYNYPPQYSIDRQMGVYMHSAHINHTEEGQFQGMKYAAAQLDSEGKPQYLESHYMMYPHYYNPHHPPMNEYMEKMRNQSIYQNRQALHNRQILKNKKSHKTSLRNDDYNDDDDYFIPEEKQDFDIEKRENFESSMKSMAGYNIEKQGSNYFEQRPNFKQSLKKPNQGMQSNTERLSKENINQDEKNSKNQQSEIKVMEIISKSKDQTKKPRRPKSQSIKTNVDAAINTNGNLNQSADNGHPEVQQSNVVNQVNSTLNFGQNNFEAIIEPPSTGPSIISKSKPISKIPKTKKKLEQEDEEYVESRYSKKNKQRSRRRNHAGQNSGKVPKKRGRHLKYKGKSSSIAGEDQQMINDIGISQKQSDYLGSDPESQQNLEGSQSFESFQQINNRNQQNGKTIPGQKRFNDEEIFLGESEIFEQDEGINIQEII